MAVLGSVLAAVYAARLGTLLPAGLPAGARESASQGLGDAVVVGSRLGGAQGERVLEAARTAYVDGMHVGDLVAAALLLAGAVLALVTLPRRGAAAVREPDGSAFPVASRSA
jgi:DHA2 family multidrug resistance protein-like MFS transporter